MGIRFVLSMIMGRNRISMAATHLFLEASDRLANNGNFRNQS